MTNRRFSRDDLRRFLRTMEGPGLWIPQPRHSMPSTVAPLRTAIESKEVGLPTPTIEELVASLACVPRGQAILRIAQLAITLANYREPDDRAHQLQVAVPFFANDVWERLNALVTGEAGRGIFHRLQLLTLQRLLLSFPERVSEVGFNEEHMHVLGECALAINGRLEEDVVNRLAISKSEEDQNWAKAAFGVRNMLFNQASNLLTQLMGRSVLLWLDLPQDETFRPPERLLPKDLFCTATGVPLEDFLTWCLAYTLPYEKYSVISGKGMWPSFQIITGPVFRTGEAQMRVQQRVIDLLTARLEAVEPAEILHNLYELRRLRQGPLVKMEGEDRIPVDLPFMREIGPVQVFWIINDYLLARGAVESERWRIFFGHLAEHYVRTLTSAVLDVGGQKVRRVFGPGDWTVTGLKKGENAHLPDVAILYPERLLFVEVIATRLHFSDTAIAAEPDRLKRDLDQMILQPARQLQGVIYDFRRGVIRLASVDARWQIYPLIVVADTLPQFPLMWHLVFDELAKQSILADKERDSLQVWDLDELESILASVEEGSSEVQDLAGFVEKKVHDSVARFMPLQNYLFLRRVPLALPRLVRGASDRIFARLLDIMRSAETSDADTHNGV